MRYLPRALVLFVVALLCGPVPAGAQTAFSPDQRKAIEEIIGDYLVKNPEVLRKALAEVMRQEEAQQAASQKAAVTGAIEELNKPAGGLVLGNPSGDVTLVEFSDYNCGYCKKAVADVRALLKSDLKLRIIIRDVDYIGGPISDEANKVAFAVRNQLTGDKLTEYYMRLMETRGRVNGQRALDVAKELGLDMTRLQKEAASPEILAALGANDALARRIGVTGTPAFIIGDELISGAVGVDPLRQAIASTRQCGHAVC